MQRYPTRSLPSRQASGEGETPAIVKLARRIREEQGPEQVRRFIIAMRPFAAPNELLRLADDFGIDRASIQSAAEPQMQARSQSGADGLKLLQTAMQLSGAMRGGMDMTKLIGLLSGKL